MPNQQIRDKQIITQPLTCQNSTDCPSTDRQTRHSIVSRHFAFVHKISYMYGDFNGKYFKEIGT